MPAPLTTTLIAVAAVVAILNPIAGAAVAGFAFLHELFITIA